MGAEVAGRAGAGLGEGKGKEERAGFVVPGVARGLSWNPAGTYG